MTLVTSASDSPQARLAASRKALVRQMTRTDSRGENDAAGAIPDTSHGAIDADMNRDRSSTWQVISQAALAWWQHHPVQIAFDIAKPFLTNYARSKPLHLLGIAAGVGAAAVLVKPWRLVSVTGLAFAAFKSTKLSSTLLSLLPRAAPRPRPDKSQQPFNGVQ